MKTKGGVFLFLSSFLLMACASTDRTYKTAKAQDIKPYLLPNPTLVDMDVSNTKVVCEFDINNLNLYTLESYKGIAIYRACEKADCDIIVEPQFDITSKGTKVHVKIKGFPANYKNFRPYSPADSAIFIMQRFRVE